MATFDTFHPLINVRILLTEEQLDRIDRWFAKVSKPLLIVDEGPPLNVVTIENIVRFLKDRQKEASQAYHRRDFHFPTYAEIMRAAEVVNCHELRLLTKEQVIYIMNTWMLTPIIRHELMLAFQIFDTEERNFLEIEDLRNIMTQYSNVPFTEDELTEIVRDANVRGDGNVHYADFIESMFTVAPDLYNLPVDHIYDDPDEDPSVEPLPEPEPPPPPPPPPPEAPPRKAKGKKKK